MDSEENSGWCFWLRDNFFRIDDATSWNKCSCSYNDQLWVPHQGSANTLTILDHDTDLHSTKFDYTSCEPVLHFLPIKRYKFLSTTFVKLCFGVRNIKSSLYNLVVNLKSKSWDLHPTSDGFVSEFVEYGISKVFSLQYFMSESLPV